MHQKSRAVITQDGGQHTLQRELVRISQIVFVKRMAFFQKLLIFATQPPHQEDSNFFPPAPQVTFSLSVSFARGYWRGKKKAQEKKEQKEKEVVRRSCMTSACCLQNSNYPHPCSLAILELPSDLLGLLWAAQNWGQRGQWAVPSRAECHQQLSCPPIHTAMAVLTRCGYSHSFLSFHYGQKVQQAATPQGKAQCCA